MYKNKPCVVLEIKEGSTYLKADEEPIVFTNDYAKYTHRQNYYKVIFENKIIDVAKLENGTFGIVAHYWTNGEDF